MLVFSSMILVPFFLFLSWILGGGFFDLRGFLFPWTSQLHALCLSWVETGASWDFVYRSLVCGHSLPRGSFYESLRLMGLIHLMVISGTHLLFLERLLSRGFFWWSSKSLLKRGFLFLCLAFYVGVCSLKPPVVRAFLSLLVSHFNRSFKLHWPGYQKVLFTGSLCLALFPDWWSSYSLVLSWGASLSLSLARGRLREGLCFLLLYPLLLPLAPQNLTQLFFHWAVAPFLSCVLFPLSLLVSFVPFFREFGDGVWSLVGSLFSFLALSLPPLGEGRPFPLFFSWLYLFGLHFVIHFLRQYWIRRKFWGKGKIF